MEFQIDGHATGNDLLSISDLVLDALLSDSSSNVCAVTAVHKEIFD